MRRGLVALLLAWPFWAAANNGLNLIGFGTESVGMGGADIAVARDTTALNTNPAGLVRLGGPALDVFVEAAHSQQRHGDAFGNADRRVSNRWIGLGGFGWARPLGRDLVAGIGLFGQGGAGFVYRDLGTPFGGRDSVALVLGIARLTPALAWRAAPGVSLGLAAPITVAIAEQELYPGTSTFDPGDPSRSFFGSRVDKMRSTRVGARLGLMVEASPQLTLAAVFGARTALPMSHGQLRVDMSALGLGTVTYRDVRIDGLGLPQEWGLGAAWQATRSTLVSVEVTRLAWSRSLKSQALRARNPDQALAPPVLEQALALDWRDQTVLALGVAHELAPHWTVFGGLNHGRNPAPARTMSPFLAAIGERHLTLGARWRLSAGWDVSGTLERMFPHAVTYDNPQLPFGPGARERSAYLATHLMLGRRW